MPVNGGLQIAVLLAGLAANTGNHFQLLFCQIGPSFHHPRLAEILPGLRIIGGDSERTLVITNPFVRAAKFTGGIPAIIPCFRGVAVFQRIKKIQRRLVLAFLAR